MGCIFVKCRWLLPPPPPPPPPPPYYIHVISFWTPLFICCNFSPSTSSLIILQFSKQVYIFPFPYDTNDTLEMLACTSLIQDHSSLRSIAILKCQIQGIYIYHTISIQRVSFRKRAFYIEMLKNTDQHIHCKKQINALLNNDNIATEEEIAKP